MLYRFLFGVNFVIQLFLHLLFVNLLLPCLRKLLFSHWYCTVIFRLVVTVTSLSLFVVAKDHINARRLENMRSRERMRKSNEGEYPDVYRSLWVQVSNFWIIQDPLAFWYIALSPIATLKHKTTYFSKKEWLKNNQVFDKDFNTLQLCYGNKMCTIYIFHDWYDEPVAFLIYHGAK